MIKPRHLFALLNYSCLGNYDMKKCQATLKSFLAWSLLHSLPGVFSFLPGAFFHSCLVFSFFAWCFFIPVWCFFIPVWCFFIPCLVLYHSLPGALSFPAWCFFSFQPSSFSFLSGSFFISCLVHFSFLPGAFSFPAWCFFIPCLVLFHSCLMLFHSSWQINCDNVSHMSHTYICTCHTRF